MIVKKCLYKWVTILSFFAVFDYSYRDYILSWYVPLSRDEGQLYQMLSEDFWEMTKQLRMRLSEVDVVNLVCNDTVKTLHTHFCDLKAANSRWDAQHSTLFQRWTDMEHLVETDTTLLN